MGTFARLAATSSLVLSAAAAPVACGSSGTTDQPTADGGLSADATTFDAGTSTNVVVNPATVVLTDAQMATATVTDTTLTFAADGNDALSAVHAGSVLVSSTGDGFIRKVTAVQSPTQGKSRGQSVPSGPE